MRDTAEYLIHEGYLITVYADVEYQVHAAYNGGRDEPSENAWVEVISATLRQVEQKPRWIRDDHGFIARRHPTNEIITTDLGPAPAWVLKLVERDEDWLDGRITAEDDDSDYRYDSRRDEEAA